MNLKRLYRKVYTAYMTRRNPIKYAEKVGVNFVRGGDTSIWKPFMGKRALADYAWE